MKKNVFFLILLLNSVVNCFSQTIPGDRTKIKQENKFNKGNYNPAGQNSIIVPVTQVSLLSTFEDQSATANIGFNVGGLSTMLMVKQTFKEKPKKVTPLNLDGLSSGSTIELGVQYKFWNPRADFYSFENIRKEYATSKSISDEDSIRKITYSDLPTEYKDRIDIKWGVPILFGIKGSVGSVKYTYIDDSSSTNTKELSGLNYNISATLGMILPNSSTLAVIYTFQNIYDPVDPTQYIFPFNTTLGVNFSKEAIFGKPTTILDGKISIEYRCNIVNKNLIPVLGLNPSISYLSTREKISFNLPIYFLNYKEKEEIKGLQGGVAIGYLTGTDKLDKFSAGFSAGLFISAPFDVFGLFKK